MINRNNYEEYLLLYIDGELPAAERQAVESFLAVNPDLHKELQLLQQAILQPEHLPFGEKDLLYRKEEGINLGNFQEYFLLYVDEELNAAEKQSVETFVLQNPELQDEFTLLKQSVLPAEKVIFRNKEILYRKEENRRPAVISLRWASLAAAVMIAVMAMLWIFNSGDKAESRDGQVADKNQQKGTSAPATIQPQQLVPGGINREQEETPLTANKNDRSRIQQTAINSKQNPSLQAPVAVAPKQVPRQPIVEPEVIASVPATVNTTTGSYSGSPADPKATGISTPDPETHNAYVQPAVYTDELNTGSEEKNNTLLVGALQINTDKVRGLFRRAGRFLSSKVKNKDDDGEKIQVANIEVNKLK
jgi:hypothetical protein